MIDAILSPRWMILALILGMALLGGGCASTSATGVTPPPDYLMKKPRSFPRLKRGDDARVKLAEAAEVHNREARRLKGLQEYVRKSRGE